MNTVQVIGDVMLDVYETVVADRVSSEAPVVVGRHLGTDCYPGGAANAARNCLAVGSPSVQLVGAIGEDAAGKKLMIACENIQNGDFQFYILPGKGTVEKHRIVSCMGQHLLRIDREDKITCPFHYDKDYQTLLISDYDKGMFTEASVRMLIEEARKQDAYVVVNGKPAQVLGYRKAHCLVMNLKEAQESLRVIGVPSISGFSEDDADHIEYRAMAHIGRGLYSRMLATEGSTLNDLVITLGAKGMLWVTATDDTYWQAKKVHHVADVVGAGDTFCATLAAYGECSRASIEAAMSNAASVVSKRGTAVPD